MKIDNSNRNKFIFQKPIVAILCCAFASGCAVDPKTGQPSFKETFASDDPCSNNARNIGIGVGAVLGAVIGNQVKHNDKARLLGAALGATAGGLIGYDMDKRRCELSKIAKQYNLDIQVATVNASGEVIDDEMLKNIANASDIKSSAVGSVVEVSDLSLAGGILKPIQMFLRLKHSNTLARLPIHINLMAQPILIKILRRVLTLMPRIRNVSYF